MQLSNLVSIGVAILFFHLAPVSLSLINIPLKSDILEPGQESYNLIHRFANKKFTPNFSRGIKPYTRQTVVGIFLKVYDQWKNNRIQLSEIDLYHLKQLIRLYSKDIEAEGEIISPILRTKNHYYTFAMELGVAQSFEKFISYQKDQVYVTSVRPHVYGRIHDNFAFSTNIAYNFVYGDYSIDRRFDGTVINQFSGELINHVPFDAYFKFRLPWFDIEIGQSHQRWGFGYHGSLILSENPSSMDLVKINGRYGNISFTAFTSILGDLDSTVNEKYMSGHRVEGFFWNFVGVGLSEVIVYANRFEPSYLNPVTVYLANSGRNEVSDARARGSGDNTLVTADLRLSFKGLEIYGELLVDDANPADPFNYWDNKFGILTGLYSTDPLGICDADFYIEYAFINQYAYTHENRENVFKHYNTTIGHTIGTDADNFWVCFRKGLTNQIDTTVTYEVERHGEGDISIPHHKTENGITTSASDFWTPLSGLTEVTNRLSIESSWTQIGLYEIKLNLSHFWVKNVDHQTKKYLTGSEIKIKSYYQF